MTVLEQIRQAETRVPSEVLEEAVRRVVTVADPERIVLFGSAARGDMRVSSDLDLLVVKDGDYHQRRLTARLYRVLADLDRDTDIVMVRSAQLERYKDSFCLVFYAASREGKVIYDKAAL
jgi:predicted nucleotidyltransferase